MFKSNPEKCLVMLHAVIEPIVDFPARIGAAAARLAPEFDVASWTWFGNSSVAFRDFAKRMMVVVSHNHVLVQTLGLDRWVGRESHIELVASIAMDGLGIKKITRLSFRPKAYLDLQMSHSEMVDAMFGSYLAPRAELAGVAEAFDDAVVRLFGEERHLKFEIGLYPQTAEQGKADFFAWPNLETFNEPRARVATVAEFWSKIDRDVLMLDCEIFRKDVGPEAVRPFIRAAVDASDSLAERSVSHLLSLPTRK